MYIPAENEEGLTVLVSALKEYLARDTKLMGMLGGAAEDSIISEGMLSSKTPFPAIMFVTIAEGDTECGWGTQLTRLIVYVVDKGRGYLNIERILARLRRLFRAHECFEFCTFPSTVDFGVVGIRAPGSTASVTVPAFGCEMRGLYLFITTVDTVPTEAVPPPPVDPIPDPDPEPPVTGPVMTLVGNSIVGPVVNFGIGLERWRGAPAYVPNVTSTIDYQRFVWADVENDGGIHLTPIINFVNNAVANGRKAAFRIQAYVPERTSSGVPSGVPTTQYTDGTYVPQWNHPTFLTRLQALLAELGDLYNGNPNIEYIDIGIYGKWAEWHMYGFTDGYKATDATKKAIVDAHVAAFKDSELVMLTDDDYACGYALSIPVESGGLKYPIGLRRDSWGHPTQFPAIKNKAYWPVAQERWKSARFVVEAYRTSSYVFDTVSALSQVSEYHLSSAGNANINGSYSTLTQTEKDNWARIQELLGYRFWVDQVVIDTTQNQASVRWRNDGSAPAYYDISATLHLVGPTTVAIPLPTDFQALRSTVTTVVTIPGLSAGTYSCFIEADAALAQANEQNDGKYLIGQFTI